MSTQISKFLTKKRFFYFLNPFSDHETLKIELGARQKIRVHKFWAHLELSESILSHFTDCQLLPRAPEGPHGPPRAPMGPRGPPWNPENYKISKKTKKKRTNTSPELGPGTVPVDRARREVHFYPRNKFWGLHGVEFEPIYCFIRTLKRWTTWTFRRLYM